MKINTVLAISFFLILLVLFATCIFFLFMRQNQMSQQLDSEIKTLKSNISVPKINPKTTENTETIKLARELTDSNAKLINAEFSKFERDLRDSNNKWLWGWTGFFTTIIVLILAIIGVAFWFSVRSMIADRVEIFIIGFKEDVGQLDTVKDQLRRLEHQYTSSTLRDVPEGYFGKGEPQFEQIKQLREETLSQILNDEDSLLGTKYRAAAVLADRNSPLLVTPVLKYLNSIVGFDSDLSSDFTLDYYPEYYVCELIGFVGQIYTQDTHNGLKKFLNTLLTAETEHRNLLMGYTARSLALVSLEMNQKDAVPVLRKSIPDMKFFPSDSADCLEEIARYFDIFNEPAGIKEILTYHAAGENPMPQDKCLELLQKHDPEFVKEYQVHNENTNAGSEDSL